MLSFSDAEKLVHVFKTSTLDYCNALLGGCPASSINKLQIVQRAAANKILLRTYKALNGLAPWFYHATIQPAP